MPSLALSPQGRLHLEGDDLSEYPELNRAFGGFPFSGLLYLDIAQADVTEEPSFAYWKDFARLFLSLYAATPGLESRNLEKDPVRLEPPVEDLDRFLGTVPPMKGAEYVSKETLTIQWRGMEAAIHHEISHFGKGVSEYFSARHASLNLLGRVCFHLAENKKSIDTPFAFLATYARQTSKEGQVQHAPLGKALEEFANRKDKSSFLRLIAPVQRASKESAFANELLRSGEIYETLAWTPKEAHRFLKDIPAFEKAGIAVRVPNWWKPKSPNRPQVAIRLGEREPSSFGLDALVDFSLSVTLGDQELQKKEIEELLRASENLVFFKGQWVEVDRERLGDLLSKWKTAAKSLEDGLSFGEALRFLSGIESSGMEASLTEEEKSLTRVVGGKWLSGALDELRSPEALCQMEKILARELRAELRPYQKQGVAWLYRLHKMRLGGILADDMGLGKTIQVISLLLLRKHEAASDFKALLVVPASLLGNWQKELLRFAPSLRFWVAHPSGNGYKPPEPGSFDLVITTYGSLLTLKWLGEETWDTMIADEAQAIKNPGAKQAKALKAIKSQQRFALTGTPVENHLTDLWSLFDFASPGLLGSAKEFDSFMKAAKKSENPYAALRRLVRPYVLRRLKTDKSVIQDLPEKTELKSFCQLTKGQAALYQQSVKSLAREIGEADGIQRRGIVFSYLMRFKQICNHPTQLVKNGEWREADSGKFQRLREICEVIADKQEKALVFTQFREMTEPLNDFLEGIFGRKGLVLHGGTPVAKRAEMVEAFQKEEGPPFFVLSLKAGGTGLNLTAASHVIHFDRWWNPAVENQATDRVFRIGQKKNVLVHKFLCQGTLEEKIDTLIERKASLSKELLGEGEATLLTELSNDELLKIVALDIHSAVADS